MAEQSGQNNESLEIRTPLSQVAIFLPFYFAAFILDAAEGRAGFIRIQGPC